MQRTQTGAREKKRGGSKLSENNKVICCTLYDIMYASANMIPGILTLLSPFVWPWGKGGGHFQPKRC